MESSVEYLRQAIGDQTDIDWYCTAPRGPSCIAVPADIYFRTSAGELTWGWSVDAPRPEERRLRRLRHPDGWPLLFDADDPEMVILVPDIELHVVSTGDAVHASVEQSTGGIPDYTDALTLAGAAKSNEAASYQLLPAISFDRISAALEMWAASLAEVKISFSMAEPGPEERSAITELAGSQVRDVAATSNVGFDDETAELLAGFATMPWFQRDLSWPDRDDREAFRDRIDIQVRDEDGTPHWITTVEPPGPGIIWVEGDGLQVGLYPDDPTRLALDHDRLVLALSREADGFEPAGLAVEGAPGSDQWEELRTASSEYEGTSLISALAWSEDAVSRALAVWASEWTDIEIEFVYDFNDPVPQAAIEANNALDEGPASGSPLRTGTTTRCTHQTEPELPFEDPLPCGRPATHYYQDGERVVVVCGEHIPPGRPTTVLMRQ